jgi:hypothetical protein
MAIDARISMMGQAPNVGQAINIFENALMNSQTRDIRQQQADQQALLNPLQAQLTQQSVDAGKAQANDIVNQRKLKSINDFAIGNQSIINDAVNTGDPTQLQGALVKRREQIVQQGLPTDETDEAIAMLGQGDIQGVISGLSDSVKLYSQQKGKTTGQRDFDSSTQGFSEEDRIKARRIELGLDPRASLSSQERIARDKVLGQQVVDQKSAEATGTETGKSETQLKFKPKINRAVKLAEKEAIERGDVLTELGRMEASLPGVKEVVNELLELSDIATSTLGGKAFDFVVKQSGFGSTKGATANAKMEAIVDNQVLPLLKETFGAAFTATEGEALKASLVNPDSSPAQRRAQLEAFLAQKERNVRTKQTQAGQPKPVEAGINEFAGFKVIR